MLEVAGGVVMGIAAFNALIAGLQAWDARIRKRKFENAMRVLGRGMPPPPPAKE